MSPPIVAAPPCGELKIDLKRSVKFSGGALLHDRQHGPPEIRPRLATRFSKSTGERRGDRDLQI